MTRHRKGSKRQARRASIERKRNAFYTWKTPPNKKPGIAPGLYTFPATGAPYQAPDCEPEPHTTEVLAHEFCS